MAWAAALWTLGAVGIYINSKEFEKEAIWARIEVIGATSDTLHYYGSKSTDLNISGHVTTSADVATLEGYCDSDTTRTLTGPNGFSKDCKVVRVRSRRVPDASDVTKSIYLVQVELIVV